MTIMLCLLQISYLLGIFSVFSIGTFGFSFTELVSVGILGYVAVQWVWNGKPMRIPRRMEVLFSIGLWFAFAVSALVVAISGDRLFMIQSAKTFSHFTMIWICAMALVFYPVENRQWNIALRVNVILSVIAAIYAMYQLPARMMDWPFGWVEIQNASFARGQADGADTQQLALQFADFYRATSIFSEPSSLAGQCTSSMIVLLIPLLRGTPSVFRSRKLTWTFFVILMIALLLAFSLTGVIILSAFAMLAVVMFGKRALRKFTYITVIVTVVLVLANMVVHSYTQFDILATYSARITNVITGKAASNLASENMVGESYTQRTSDYEMSLLAWLENPVTGVGPGCFSLSDAGKTHNSPFVATSYGTALAEIGLPGCIALFGMFILAFVGCFLDYREWRQKPRDAESELDLLTPLLPFRIAHSIVSGFTSNAVVSANMFEELAITLGCRTNVRSALGYREEKLVYLVSTPVKKLTEQWVRKGAKVDTDY